MLEQHTEDPPSKKMKMDAAEMDVQSEGDSAVVPTVMEEGDAEPADSDVCVVCLGVLQQFCDEAYAIKVCLVTINPIALGATVVLNDTCD